PSGDLLIDGGCVEVVSIAAGEGAEKEHPDHPHLWRKQGLECASLVAEMSLFGVGFELALQPGFFLYGEPSGLVGTVGQHLQNDDAEQDGRQALEQKQPLPARQSEFAIQA